jgi:3-hydroxybutyryl-CoA dehydrogenase
MGVGIAYVFAVAGFDVTVAEPVEQQQHRLLHAFDAALSRAVARGKLTEPLADKARSHLTLVGSVDDMPHRAMLAVETVPEQVGLKREVLRDMERTRPAVLATNTSAISIDLLADSLNEPGRFMGMHFFNPVWSLPLVELIRGEATTAPTIECARAAVERIGKESILVADIPGFATSRLDMAAALEAMRMLEDGVASADDIDKAAVLAYRHPVGPLRLSDIVGLDVRLDIARSMEVSHGPRFAPPQLLMDKVAAGELGQKSGQGFHHWPDPDSDSSERTSPSNREA